MSVAIDRPSPHRPELLRLMLRVENLSELGPESSPREDAMLAAFVSTHVLLQASGGEFIDTEDAAAMLGAPTRREALGLYPLLVGIDRSDTLLCTPMR